MEFVKKPFVYDKDVMQTDYIITYGFLVQKALREYSNIVDSKWWEPTDSNNIYKDESLLLISPTVAIESTVKNTAEKYYCKKPPQRERQ